MNLLPFLLDAFRGVVILGTALTALGCTHRAPASVRRGLVLAALLAAFLAPFAARALSSTRSAPVVEVPFFVRQIAVDPGVGGVGAPPSVVAGPVRTAGPGSALAASRWAAGVTWGSLVTAVWAFGAAVVMARLGFGLVRARGLASRARRDEAKPFAAVIDAARRQAGVDAEIVISDEVEAPAVAGMFAPVVLMPRAALAWSDQRWRLVLLHELAHVARRDCLAGALGHLACAMHWFDPLVWVARQRLRRERELAADENVLMSGALASEYASHLLAIASMSQLGEVPGSLGMAARPSELAHRIEAIVKYRRSARPSRALLPGVVAAVTALTLVVACAGPRLSSPSAARAIPGPGVASTERAATPVSGASLVEEVAVQLGMPASHIELTIDTALQRIVDEELAGLVSEHHPAVATIVVLDPNQGELLAVASPGAARRAYVTGSTIKTMLVAAALDAGAIRLDQKFDTRARSYGARSIEDSKERGELDVAQILEVSSNVGASRIFDATGRERLDEGLARFHFGEASTVQLSNVAHGDVPKTVARGEYDAVLVAVGEGLTATPLQMAAAYGAIANGGEYIAPTLVRTMTDDAGRTVPRVTRRERVVRAETARTVMQLLERAVQGDQATGKGARVQGVRVAGKTGTAAWTTPDGKEHIYASFVGVIPADAPRYVILVGAADPHPPAFGSSVAAPAFAKIAARVLGAR